MASYIGQYAQNYFQRTGIQCELDIPPQLPAYPLSSQARHHIFLAAHEALTNILKHSAANRASISMACAHSVLAISISDNGRGFDPAAEADPSNIGSNDGLNNMRRRFEEIGGRCVVESSPGRGVTVHFTLPLKKATLKI